MNPAHLLEALDDAAVALSHSDSFPIRGSNVPQCPRATFALLDGADKLSISGVRARVLQVGKENHEHMQRALQLVFQGGTIEHEAFLRLPLRLSDASYKRLHDKLAASQTFARLEIVHAHPSQPLVDCELSVPLHADFSFFDRTSRTLHVVEIKTAKAFAFKKRKEEGVDTSHAVQLIAQANAIASEIGLGDPGEVRLNLSVLYENKDTCELHLESVNPDSAHWSEQYRLHVQRFSDAIVGWAEGNASLAVPIFAEQADNRGALPWQCNYCSVGPIVGKCSKQPLVNRAKPDDIPKWFIDFNAVATVLEDADEQTQRKLDRDRE